MHATTSGCPLGGVGGGSVVPLPLPEDGPGTATAGRGGSTTSDSVRTGLGASAGGKYWGVMSWMRLPG